MVSQPVPKTPNMAIGQWSFTYDAIVTTLGSLLEDSSESGGHGHDRWAKQMNFFQ